MTVVSDSHYQSTLDAVYAYVVSWLEFPIVPSYPHYTQGGIGEGGGGLLSSEYGIYISQASMAYLRQSRPNFGLGFQIKVLRKF